MATVNQLPAEIYITIFNMLPRETLKECVLVCKQWNYLATPFYFEEVCFNTPDFFSIVTKAYNSSKENNPLCHSEWVKILCSPDIHDFDANKFLVRSPMYRNTPATIIVETDSENEEEEDMLYLENNVRKAMETTKQFSNFFSLFPNLRIIDFVSFPFKIYTLYLNQLKELANIYLKNLEEIVIHAACPELHFQTCYAFRQSITQLYVFYNKYELDGSTTSKYPLSYLSHFVRLQRLTVFNTQNNRLTCFDILNVCPTLSELRFESKFAVNQLSPSIYHSLKNTNISPRLKSLVLTLPKLTLPYIEYIPHIHQQYMRTLEINLYGSLLVKDLDSRATTAIQFLHCVSKIEFASFFSFKYVFENEQYYWTSLEQSLGFDQIMSTVKKHDQQLHDTYYSLYPPLT